MENTGSRVALIPQGSADPPAGHRVSHSAAPLLCSAALLIAGCRTYEPRPLDLDSTREMWLARTPGDDPVHALARSLEPADPGAPAFDAADGLSMVEAEIVAMVFNRSLRLARLDAGVAQATAEHAGRWEDPVLGLDVERVISGVPDPWVVGGTIGLTIPISGRLGLESDLARADAAAAIERVAAQEWSVRCEVRRRWVEWSVEAARQRLTVSLVERLRRVSDLADRQARGGVMSSIDARLFRVELAGAEADLLATEARVRELELDLREVLGLSPDAPATLLEQVACDAPTGDEIQARDRFERAGPALAVARAEYEAAERALSLEIREQYPDLQIGPGAATDEGTDRLLLGLSLPLPIWNGNRQAIAEAAARRDAARGRFEAAYEEGASRLAVAWARLDAARRVRELIERSVLPLAEEQDRDVQRVMELGRVDPLVLLQSLQTRHNAAVRWLEAGGAESLAAIGVDEVVGPAAPTGGEQHVGPSDTGVQR